MIGSLSIDPAEVRVNDTLTCLAENVTDVDEDTVDVTYSWTIDGAEAGDGTNQLTGPFSLGSVIECTASHNDGIAHGASMVANVTTLNTVPGGAA